MKGPQLHPVGRSRIVLEPQAVPPAASPGAGFLYMDTAGNLVYVSPAGTRTTVVSGP